MSVCVNVYVYMYLFMSEAKGIQMPLSLEAATFHWGEGGGEQPAPLHGGGWAGRTTLAALRALSLLPLSQAALGM